MATVIDERVVEMRFDNKQFEEGTKTTLNSLEKLKKALHLDGATKGLENIDKAAKQVSLEGIAADVEALKNRFSTLGIVGMQVIQNITNSLTNTLAKGINFVTDSIVSGGIKRAMNIENAHFQLQALLKDEERVQAVMKNANDSVTGTAYAYDEAAKAASQFAASGIKEGEQMMEALMGVVGVASMTNSEYEGVSRIFTTVAGNGRLMGDQLLQLSSRGLNAAATIAEYFSNVNSGAIQANDSVTAAIKSITKATNVTERDIREWVSDGIISFDIFAAAMNNAFGDAAMKANTTFTGAFSNMKSALARIGAEFVSPLVAQESEVVRLFNALRVQINNVKSALTFSEEAGNVNALSKQFTDTMLKMAGSAADFVENADLTKPLQLFYYGVETAKNAVKGLFSVLKPVGEAFGEVFLAFDIDDVIRIADAIETITYNMKLTDRASNNLKKTFKGVFDITKLLVDILIKMAKPFVSLIAPTQELAGGMLDVSGGIGETLSSFSKWVRESATLQKVYEIYSKSIEGIGNGLKTLTISGREFINTLGDIPIVKSAIESLKKTISQLDKAGVPALDNLKNGLKWVRDNFEIMVPDWVKGVIDNVTESIQNLSISTINFDISSIRNGFQSIKEAVQDFLKMIHGSDGLMSFLDNAKNFGIRLKEGFSFDAVTKHIDKFKTTVTDFVKWMRETIGPAFDDFTIGGAVASGGGVALIYSLLKISKSMESVTKPFDKFSGALGAISGALKAYQQDLKADAIMKIAISVGIFAGSLILLSFVDTDRLSEVAFSLALVSGVILFGISKLLDAFTKVKGLRSAADIFANSLNNISKGIKSAIKNFGRAKLISSIGTTFKNIAEALLIVAATCVGLGLMYQKNKDAVEDGMKLAGLLAAVMTGIIGAMAIIGKISGGFSDVKKAASGVLALSLSLAIVVFALNKLFKMEFPSDYNRKLDILAGLFVGLGLLAVVLGKAAKDATGKVNATPILALAATLYISVTALNKLFKMEFPYNWESRYAALMGIFGALALVVLALGKAGKYSGGALKATGTILAICAFVTVAVGSLMILSLFPGDKLLKGAIALGAVLVALGASLAGAGKIANDKAYKSVVGMALIVGTITAALGILSMVPMEMLVKAGAALGAMLLALAIDFKAISSISGNGSWPAIVGMISTIIVITGSLVILAAQPWEGMLAAGIALGSVLSAFGLAFKMISDANDISLEKIALFLAATIAVLPIGAALYELSLQPWDGLLGAGAAMSLVVVAFAAAFKIISTADGIDMEAIALFLAATLGVIPIGIAINELAGQPWEGMLAAGTAISEVLLSIAAVMAICSKVRMTATEALNSLAVLDLFIADFAVVLIALGGLLAIPEVQSLMQGGVTAFEIMGSAIGGFAGNIIGGIGKGMSDALPAIGENLSAFTDKASRFFTAIKTIDESSTRGVKYLAETVLILTGASLLDGIIRFFGGGGNSLSKFGEELEKFGPHIAKYSTIVARVKPESVEASANAAKMMADMANSLPNSGGLAGKIFGENNLSDFGEELEKFGPHIAQYAKDVYGLEPSSVEASANAAKMMADMANSLPNSGGLLGAIVGNNDLSKFGEELEKFGPHIAKYAEDVQYVKPETVSASASAVKMMVDLANEIPNMGGLFSGESKFAIFGSELESLGKSLLNYATTLSEISWNMVGVSVTEIQRLLDLAELAEGTSASSLTYFFDSLNNVGTEGVRNFVTAFSDASGNVSGTITTFITSAVNVLKNKGPLFQVEGVNAVTKYLTGFRSQSGVGVATVTTFSTSLITTLRNKGPLFLTEGQTAAQKYLEGIRSQYSIASSTGVSFASYVVNGLSSTVSRFTSAARSLISAFVTTINQQSSSAQNAGTNVARSAYSGLSSGVGDWYSIGSNAGGGFVNGIRSQISAAQAAAQELANAAPKAARSTLKIHSPSRVMEQIGDYTGLGFIGKLLSYVSQAGKVGKEMAENTAKGASQGMKLFDHLEPVFLDEGLVLRPSVDLSNIEAAARKTQEMFNEAMTLSNQKARVLENSITEWNNTKKNQSNNEPPRESNDQNGGNQYQLVQNFYSPKALSRIDIYRDTKNLFTQFKEVVDNK